MRIRKRRAKVRKPRLNALGQPATVGEEAYYDGVHPLAALINRVGTRFLSEALDPRDMVNLAMAADSSILRQLEPVVGNHNPAWSQRYQIENYGSDDDDERICVYVASNPDTRSHSRQGEPGAGAPARYFLRPRLPWCPSREPDEQGVIPEYNHGRYCWCCVRINENRAEVFVLEVRRPLCHICSAKTKRRFLQGYMSCICKQQLEVAEGLVNQCMPCSQSSGREWVKRTRPRKMVLRSRAKRGEMAIEPDMIRCPCCHKSLEDLRQKWIRKQNHPPWVEDPYRVIRVHEPHPNPDIEYALFRELWPKYYHNDVQGFRDDLVARNSWPFLCGKCDGLFVSNPNVPDPTFQDPLPDGTFNLPAGERALPWPQCMKPMNPNYNGPLERQTTKSIWP